MYTKQTLLTRKDYFKWLKTISPDSCPFCDDINLNKTIIKRGKLWDLVFCIAPYWPNHLMLVPRRHFVEFSDMNPEELSEFIGFYNEIVQKLRKMDLCYSDKTPVDRYLFFWRLRDNQFDAVTGVTKPNHFHFHVVPEKEHLLDKVLDENATAIDTEKFIDLFNKN